MTSSSGAVLAVWPVALTAKRCYTLDNFTSLTTAALHQNDYKHKPHSERQFSWQLLRDLEIRFTCMLCACKPCTVSLQT